MPRAYLKLHSWSRVKEEMSGRNIGQRGGNPAGYGVVFGIDPKHVGSQYWLEGRAGA